MFQESFLKNIALELEGLNSQGLYKNEYEIICAQHSEIEIFHHQSKKKRAEI